MRGRCAGFTQGCDRILGMTQKIRNPVELPLPLLPAEVGFARCLRSGTPCVLSKETAAPVVGHPDNTIRTEVIRFFAYGGSDEYPVLGSAIYLQGAWICGEQPPLDLTHADIRYALGFFHCHFTGRVEMISSKCPALYMLGSRLAKGLQAGGLRTDGPVHLRKGFVADNEVDLSRAHISGDLDCSGGKFNNPNGRALTANHITVKGEVFLHDGFSAKGEVRLLSARIDGDLNCTDGKFSNMDNDALSADGMTVGGSVFLKNSFFAGGQVKFPNARINGDLDCTNGKFCNLKKGALNAPGITVGSNMFLCEDFAADGLVNILGANIGGNLDCASGHFYSVGDYALNAERVVTGGHVFLNKHKPTSGNRPFFARGRVRFANADIGRNFNCKGGNFSHPGKKSAIAAAGLRTRGAVFLSEGFAVQGNVDLNVARIGGNFVCKKCGLAEGIIDLSSSKAAAVDDDSDSWEKFEFILDGFTYEDFYSNSPRDSKSRLEWLAKRPDNIPFSPLPYEQAAKVLRTMGKGIDAWDIERKKRQLERAEGDSNNPLKFQRRRLWGWTIDKLTDFVYRPWKTLRWAFIMIVASTFLFNCANDNGRMVPHQSSALTSMKYQYGQIPAETPGETVVRKFPGYPEFHPFLFSVDTFVPLLNLHQESFWYPAPDGGRPYWWSIPKGEGFSLWFWLEWWYWFHIVVGEILTSLFLLSVTGLLRPRQSSGEKD